MIIRNTTDNNADHKDDIYSLILSIDGKASRMKIRMTITIVTSNRFFQFL